MNALKLLFFIILCGMTQPLFSQKIHIQEPVRFLALGDSYTIGEGVDSMGNWPNQFFNRLDHLGLQLDQLQIIAKTGWRTDQLIQAIADSNPQNFNLVSLLIGVNNQYQGREPAEMKSDFQRLLQEAIDRAGGNKKQVFVLSIPDYAFSPFGQKKDPKKISEEINSYNLWQKDYCLQQGLVYIDITGVSREALDNPELGAPDGLHPSEKQYSRWIELISRYIED